MKLSYEANVLNGMQALDAEGNPTPFSRLLGQSSASEPGLIAFQATNGHGRAEIQSEIITNYHCCPVKGRTESTGCQSGGILLGSPVLGVPVKWAFSQRA